MSGDFLSRWSRRKRAAEAEPKVPPPPSEVADPGQAADGKTEPPAATPVELPNLDDLTSHSDLTAFLQQGVPVSLRNAALRRMWSLDPAIRDYVGDARDYAWDWNVPGGVPGTGPLSVEETSGALRDMWRSLGGEPGAAEPERVVEAETPPAESASSPHSLPATAEAGHPDAGQEGPDAPLLASAPPSAAGPLESRPAAEPDVSTMAALPHPAGESHAPLRRHGRARPV
jgi:hypothetical protein